MHGDKTQQSHVENYVNARFLICQQLVFRLVVFKVVHFLTPANHSFLHRLARNSRVSQTKRTQLLYRCVKRLHTQEISHVPHFYHTSDISSDYLRSLGQAFDPNQGMIVPSQQEYFIFDISVPDEGLMVEPSTEQTLVHLAPIAPVQGVYAFIVPSQLFFQLVVYTIPQTYVSAQTSRHQSLLTING